MNLFGGIEAGGTKFICGIGTGPDDLRAASFSTTSPNETVNRCLEFFRQEAAANLSTVGIASFGPIDLDPESPTYGYITSTPKSEWQNFDFVGTVRRTLNVPVAFDTDVNAAALAEGRWGAALGLTHFLYLTIGTGIGGGAMIDGKLLHGLTHTEMGHIRIPHDSNIDSFPGICPFHKDCLEGLASGPAIQERWGSSAFDLPADHPAWSLEARYLSLALANWVCTLSPKRIVMGGGIMQQNHLFPLVRRELKSILNGYIESRSLNEDMDRYVVAPSLGSSAGVLGAILLAQIAR